MQKRISIIVGLFLSIVGIVDASNDLQKQWYNNFYIIGYGCLSNNFVKAWEYPVGRQYEYNYGGMLIYKSKHVSPMIQVAYHDAFISVPNGYILYRKFSGFDASIGSRIPFSKKKLKSSECDFGAGIFISGSFDKYEDIDQYMVYPKGGIEFYANYDNLRRIRFVNIGVSVPIKYAVRSSGNYISVGLSSEIGLRIPPKHEKNI